jgi:CubicO group peptidase (beta-lactamase class C family)
MIGVEERIRRIETGLRLDRAVSCGPYQSATLKERMDFYATPGLSLAVVDQGMIDWARGYGLCESGKPRPVSEETRFQAGSIGKFITGIGVLRLAQQGVIDLDEDVNHYLKSWKIPAYSGWSPRVTLAHLLSHTASVNLPFTPGYNRLKPVPSTTQLLNGDLPANTPPIVVDGIPGLSSRYSGGGFIVIQQALEDAFDDSFPSIMQELVLDPLGMANSTFELLGCDSDDEDIAVSHPYGMLPLRDKWQLYPDMASAGLWSTPTDIARAAIEVQAAYSGQTNRILSPEMARRMLTSPGLGAQIYMEGSVPRFGEMGWNLGYISTLSMFVNDGVGAIVMYNSIQSHAILTRELTRAIAEEYSWPDRQKADGNALDLSDSRCQALAGVYDLGNNLDVEVNILTTKSLTLKYPGQRPIALTPRSETEFYSTSISLNVNFSIPQPGEDVKITLSNSSKVIGGGVRRSLPA